MIEWSLFVWPFVSAAVLSWLLAPIVIRLYRKFKWLDDPKRATEAKVIHTYPVPRGGGLVIGLTLLVTALLYMGTDKHTLGILAGAMVLMMVGWIDDLRDSNPYWRLFWGLVAALCVVGVGIGIAFVTNPFGPGVIHLNQPQLAFTLLGQTHTIWVIADIFALIWILWCMNMVNWSKGLDGQLPGVVVIAALVIGVLSFRFTEDVTQWDVSILAAITSGAYLGFLPWNVFPQKMMPGYGGGALAGYLLAILSILSGAKLATLILVLGVPMLDAVYVILRRLKEKKSPVWGDRGHLHHKLLDLGWRKQTVAYFYWTITLVLGLIALRLNAREKMFTILLIGMGFGALITWLNSLITSSKRPDRDSG